jgi:adenylate cyclase
MGLNERPIRAQQLRLEQAGYTEWDRPEDLGRQDHSYLIKFIFKPDVAPRSGSDDFNMTTYEYVDLRARSLMTIPIFLYNHAHDIVSLNLSRNAKLDLPADFVQLCTALRELRLSDTYIKRIPQSVRQATGLTRLDISSNRLLEMDHIRLDEIKELILLEAYDNRLQGLPDYFANFAALKYLNVSNNKFEAFPDVICSIVTLIDLDLSFNSLPSIPAEISKLKNLERFHIVGNMITALPTTFEALHKLQEFDCRQNNIESFAVLSEVPRLLSLRCDYNRCSVLDLHSSTLRSFSISYNPLTRFNIIGTGVSLTQLNISHGKLVELDPECFKHLNALETLIFDSNQIRTLSEELGTLTSLLRLSGKNNKLESLPESIGNLSRLQYLNVANNNLGELPATIWFAPDLIYLNASSNLLDDFPDPPASNPNEDREHDIIDRKMSAASKISISRGGSPLALSLQELYLADNRLVDEIFHPVSLMTDLRILNLSFNDIVEIPHLVEGSTARGALPVWQQAPDAAGRRFRTFGQPSNDPPQRQQTYHPSCRARYSQEAANPRCWEQHAQVQHCELEV